VASKPLPPPPAPRALSESDARTQRRLDAARAARARLRLTAPTPQTLRERVATHRQRLSAYIHRNRTEISLAIQWALCAIGATIFILLSLALDPILLLFPILAWVISIGVRWGNAASAKQPRP